MRRKIQLKLPHSRILIVIGLSVCLAGFLTANKPIHQESEIEACAECHEDIAKAFMSKPHAVTNSCTSCHGDAETHLDEGGGPNIFAFAREDNAPAKANKCISCHLESNSRYLASPHGKAALDCMTCHSVHAHTTEKNMLKLNKNKTCFVCHEDIASQFQLNERHRLQEGVMDCTTCHDPHEPAARQRLAGFKHEACFRCHTDKEGPYLFEHEASRIEGCTSCHEVHGTPNRRMLTHHSIADLCYSCHGAAPSWHARFDAYSSNCTSCHATIHGSNLSKIFLK
jgi:DmsE family decaheme c-type cytochrome